MQPDQPAPQPAQGAGAPEYQFGSGALRAADGRMWPAITIAFGPATFQLIGAPETWPAIRAAIVARMDEALVEATKAGSGLMVAKTMPPEPSPNGSAFVHP